MKGLKLGQEVWGATFPSTNGTHNDYVIADSNSVGSKPNNLDFIKAAAVPYAGITALSALHISGELGYDSKSRNQRKRVLILGASGGVGHFALQILKESI